LPGRSTVQTRITRGGHVHERHRKITPNEHGTPRGKLADAELHFAGGDLDGMKLIGFSVWKRRSGNGHTVTFPARQYAAAGARRTFALLRPILTLASQHASGILCSRRTQSTNGKRQTHPTRELVSDRTRPEQPDSN
jgi:hypothetical protein